MALSNRLSSSSRLLMVLVISLLLVNASGVNAQNNPANPGATATPTPTPTATPTPTPTPTPSATPTPTPSAVDTQRGKLLNTYWYPFIVSVLFGGLIIGFAATIARVILRSKSSFRSPLGLPDGSLRAMLAFMLVAFLGFYVYASILSLSDFRLPDSLLGIIATVVGFYFGSRSGEATGATTGRTGSVEGVVTDSAGAAAAGATVELKQGANKKFTQTADLNGKYDFENVPIGDYEIQASLTGHAPSDSAKVKVAAGGTQTVNLKLK